MPPHWESACTNVIDLKPAWHSDGMMTSESPDPGGNQRRRPAFLAEDAETVLGPLQSFPLVFSARDPASTSG